MIEHTSCVLTRDSARIATSMSFETANKYSSSLGRPNLVVCTLQVTGNTEIPGARAFEISLEDENVKSLRQKDSTLFSRIGRCLALASLTSKESVVYDI